MKRFGSISIAIALFAGALYITACKQEKGERCQVRDDCADGLVCAQATQTCQETTGGGIDALPPDAPDELPIDAAPDAAPDAPPDGMPAN